MSDHSTASSSSPETPAMRPCAEVAADIIAAQRYANQLPQTRLLGAFLAIQSELLLDIRELLRQRESADEA